MVDKEIPYGYCKCGCGQKTKIPRVNDATHGRIAGKPLDYVYPHKKARPVEERFWEKVDKRGPDECWLWTAFKDEKGYGIFRLGSRTDKSIRTEKAHRLAWKFANGEEIPAGKQICHTCDNPSCVNPVHLWLGTNLDNSIDALQKGKYNRKLTAEDAMRIRKLSALGVKNAAIAKAYDVDPSHISHIIGGDVWVHI